MGEVFYHEKRKGDLIEEAVSLWNVYGGNYRKFKQMIDSRGDPHGIRIVRAVVEEFPRITFLELETEEDVREYLKYTDDSYIKIAIRKAKSLDTNYAYRTLKARSVDIRYLDKRHPKCPFRDTRIIGKRCNDDA